MKKHKYSIRRALYQEGITFEQSERYGDTDFPSVPVDDIVYIYGGYPNQVVDGDDMGKWYSSYWESDLSKEDVMNSVLGRMDYWFSQNPKASALVKEKLSSTKVKKQKMKAAIPIFADAAGDGATPQYVMYMGQIAPPTLMAKFRAFRKVLERGAKAEDAFRNWLISKGLTDAEVIGGSANPDVVSLGMKFEVGAGNKKRLSLGSDKGRVGPVVQPRREALDKYSPERGTIPSEGVLEIWRATGYDVLVQDWGKQWAIFSLSDKPFPQPFRDVFEYRPQQLDSSMCGAVRPELNSDGHWQIKYNSLDWSQSTKVDK